MVSNALLDAVKICLAVAVGLIGAAQFRRTSQKAFMPYVVLAICFYFVRRFTGDSTRDAMETVAFWLIAGVSAQLAVRKLGK